MLNIAILTVTSPTKIDNPFTNIFDKHFVLTKMTFSPEDEKVTRVVFEGNFTFLHKISHISFTN